ncbi:MAG: DUF3253 domain-containing protein [Maribacter sp.]
MTEITKERYDTIKGSHLMFAEERGLYKTYCPSEVAKACFPKNWRKYMDVVRGAADNLVATGNLVVLQNGKIIPVKAVDAKGPIRLRKK